jgi:hypothetical protein
MLTIDNLAPEWRTLRIHQPSPATALPNLIARWTRSTTFRNEPDECPHSKQTVLFRSDSDFAGEIGNKEPFDAGD